MYSNKTLGGSVHKSPRSISYKALLRSLSIIVFLLRFLSSMSYIYIYIVSTIFCSFPSGFPSHQHHNFPSICTISIFHLCVEFLRFSSQTCSASPHKYHKSTAPAMPKVPNFGPRDQEWYKHEVLVILRASRSQQH